MQLPSTISELQKALVHGSYTAVELVDTYLERIKRLDPEINSFLTISEEEAYQKAKEVDEIVSNEGQKAFAKRPLLGAVVAHKDLFLTKGVRTTAASKVLADYVPSYSATAVKRLASAGAIMIGKVNCDAWAHGASGENSDFGATKNPWNTDFVPGGSSSGSAASVSANFATFATGTDTGGSVRQPASFTNLVGLKPTYGRVSRYGVVAMASSLDTVGHVTRSVSDSRKVFSVLKGADTFDSTLKSRTSAKISRKKATLRVGIPKEYYGEGLQEEVQKIVKAAAGVFEGKGYKLVPVSLPHTKYAISVYYIIQPAEVSSNLGRYTGVRYGNKRNAFGSEAVRRIMLGTYVLSAGYYDEYYLKAMKVRSLIIKDFEEAFKKVDVLLAPVSPTPPFKIGAKTKDPLEMYLADVYTANINLAGLPALSIPGGFTEDRLPVGFQLIAPKFSEAILFDMGELYQKETNWHERRPEL